MFCGGLGSFETFFDKASLALIARDVTGMANFVETVRRAQGISDACIHILDRETTS
jgi:hypothetical protein